MTMLKKFWLVCLIDVLCFGAVQGQIAGGESTYQRLQPEIGERCLVCNMPLGPNDLTLLVRGRRVPLKQAMVDSFLNNQEQFFAKVQPRGALFQESLQRPNGIAQGGITSGWFVAGAYLLLALLMGGLSGYLAVSKGLPATRYFFSGFLFSVVGLLWTLTRPGGAQRNNIPKGLRKVPNTAAPVACPQCGGSNHPSAAGCPECGAVLTPAIEAESLRVEGLNS